MKIDRRLNLVLPVETDSGTIWVHSTPISRETFERYYRVITRTVADIADDHIANLGPIVGFLAMRDAARALDDWDGPDGVEQGLLPEIRRLTNVIAPSAENGTWQPLPFDVAVQRGVLDDNDQRDVLGAVVFFICVSATAPPRGAAPILNGMFGRWGGQITSQHSTGFANSLPISTPGVNSGETEPSPAAATASQPAY